jgi:4-hydroxythreonine-4-phosphate dehydrogenase
MKPTIGILMGEAAGIGPELIAKLCVEGVVKECCKPIIIGDVRVLNQGMEIANSYFGINIINKVSEAKFDQAIDMIDLNNLSPEDYKLGEINPLSGDITVKTLKMALNLCKSKELDGVLYAPLNKASFKKAGYDFKDGMELMTNYLKFDRPYGEINIIDGLWTMRVTSHIPLSEVPKCINIEKIVEVIELAYKAIKSSGIDKPRIAIAGVNPHNGESGLCGREEIDKIQPAVMKAKEKGIEVHGPYPSDTLFIRAFNGEFDMVITMYHDQGQIAMKLKDFSNIVTVVGGIDYPMATPAHGTAFDIVGKGIANVNPTLRALEIVSRMASNKE